MDLTPHNRKLAAASFCFPFSLNKGEDLIDCLDKWDGPLTKSITPNCEIGTDRMMQILTLRGVAEDRLKRPRDKAGRQRKMAAYSCGNIEEMLKLYMSCACYSSATNVLSERKALSVGTPFPGLFDPFIDVEGSVTAEERPRDLREFKLIV